MFNNEVVWMFIALAVVFSIFTWSLSRTEIEKEKTKQLELHLKVLEAQNVSTNYEK
jgi:hypothetical protein